MKNGNGHGSAVLDEMLEPVTRSFGTKTARAVAALRVGTRLQARVEKLAEKCETGKLTTARDSMTERTPRKTLRSPAITAISTKARIFPALIPKPKSSPACLIHGLTIGRNTLQIATGKSLA